MVFPSRDARRGRSAIRQLRPRRSAGSIRDGRLSESGGIRLRQPRRPGLRTSRPIRTKAICGRVRRTKHVPANRRRPEQAAARQDARIRFRPCGPAKAAPRTRTPEYTPPLKKRIAPDERSPSRAIFYPQPAACRRHCATTTLPPPPFPAAGKRLPSKQSDRRFSTGTEKRHRPEHTSRTNRGRFSASALPILRSSRILPSAPCPAGTADPPRHAVRPVARPRSVSDTHRTGRNRKRQEAQRTQKRYPR